MRMRRRRSTMPHDGLSGTDAGGRWPRRAQRVLRGRGVRFGRGATLGSDIDALFPLRLVARISQDGTRRRKPEVGALASEPAEVGARVVRVSGVGDGHLVELCG